MKKIFMAIVTMLVMSTSVMAQSNDNNISAKTLTFDRISSYLELTTQQVEPVRLTLAQMGETLKAFENAPLDHNTYEASLIVLNNHKRKMKGLLTEKQYKKYEQILDKTIANRSDSLSNKQN